MVALCRQCQLQAIRLRRDAELSFEFAKQLIKFERIILEECEEDRKKTRQCLRSPPA